MARKSEFDSTVDKAMQALVASHRPEGTVWAKGNVPGYGARLWAPSARYPEGSVAYVLNYTNADGLQRRLTIGKRPLWTDTSAKARAEELRRTVDNGDDPAAEKRERRDAPTMSDLAKRTIADYLPTLAAFHNENHRKATEKMIWDVAIFIGKQVKIDDVVHEDVQRMHTEITNTPTRSYKATRPTRGNHCHSWAHIMFKLAMRVRKGEDKPWRSIERGNPADGVKLNPLPSRERFFSEIEMQALMDGFEYVQTESKVQSDVRALMFMCFTGCRPGEARNAWFDQFYHQDADILWDKPPMSTKQRKQHKVRLNPGARIIYEQLCAERKPGQKFLFPHLKDPKRTTIRQDHPWLVTCCAATFFLWERSGDPKIRQIIPALKLITTHPGTGRRIITEPSIKRCQDYAASQGVELPKGLLGTRPYDLRHTFGSATGKSSKDPVVVMKLLGHSSLKTTMKYIHVEPERMLQASTEATANIAAALAPKPVAPSDTVKRFDDYRRILPPRPRIQRRQRS
jgi:integrase